MSGALTRKVVLVDHWFGRGAANRGGTGINEAVQAPAAHGFGNGEGTPDGGGADRPTITKGRTGRQVEDVFDAVQMRRAMPVVGKKIAAQYLDVLGERVGRRE